MPPSRLSRIQTDVYLVASPDGYVRLSTERLLTIAFIHCLSGLDETKDCDKFEGATGALISGYTELVTNRIPAITVGWDWQLNCHIAGDRYVRDGMPRTNLMLIDPTTGADLGDSLTLAILSDLIDIDYWSHDIRKYICHRYGMQVSECNSTTKMRLE